MLVLSRRVGERIVIGGTIEITVVQIDRGKIRLGITAPKDVMVMRKELLVKEEGTDEYRPAHFENRPPHA